MWHECDTWHIACHYSLPCWMSFCLLVRVLLCLFLSWRATSKVVQCWTKRLTYCSVKHKQFRSTAPRPQVPQESMPFTLIWRLGSTLWCNVIAAQRNCLWNWFLVVCLPAGPVAYAWFTRWVYCLISLMIVASWLKEQCFAGISSCICSPNGWFCFHESGTWLRSVMPIAMVNTSCRESIGSIARGGMYSLWDLVREHDEQLITREGSMLFSRGLDWSTCAGYLTRCQSWSITINCFIDALRLLVTIKLIS